MPEPQPSFERRPDPTSPLYVPAVDLGGFMLRDTMAIEVREREMNDFDTVQRILGSGIDTVETIEHLTVTNYSPMIQLMVRRRFSPELWAMQDRWTRDEWNHAQAVGTVARQLGKPSLIETGQVRADMHPHKKALFAAAGMLTLVSPSAASKITCTIAFGGAINEIQGGWDYATKEEQLRSAKEFDLADLYAQLHPHEATHAGGYKRIFRRHWDKLTERGKRHVLWMGPGHFDMVGEPQVGAYRLGELLVAGGHDIKEIITTLDEHGSRLTNRPKESPLSFAEKALLACARSYKEDYELGQTAEQQGLDPLVA